MSGNVRSRLTPEEARLVLQGLTLLSATVGLDVADRADELRMRLAGELDDAEGLLTLS